MNGVLIKEFDAFRARIDPDLKIDWKFNGSPLTNSSRLKTISDFGYVMLDISSVDSRDSGEYICTATNK